MNTKLSPQDSRRKIEITRVFSNYLKLPVEQTLLSFSSRYNQVTQNLSDMANYWQQVCTRTGLCSTYGKWYCHALGGIHSSWPSQHMHRVGDATACKPAKVAFTSAVKATTLSRNSVHWPISLHLLVSALDIHKRLWSSTAACVEQPNATM